MHQYDQKIALSGEIGGIVINTKKLFPNLVTDMEKLNTEWRLLADIESLNQTANYSFQDFWNNIFNMKNDMDQFMFPHLSVLVKGILSLPHSSAAAERVFSQLFLLKTKIRNRLDVDTCSSIIHTKELVNNYTCYTWTPSSNLLKRKFK